MTIQQEGGGHLVTCVCDWLRWSVDRADAQRGLTKHQKTCKGEPSKGAGKS